jgi:hypothetical protein
LKRFGDPTIFCFSIFNLCHGAMIGLLCSKDNIRSNNFLLKNLLESLVQKRIER